MTAEALHPLPDRREPSLDRVSFELRKLVAVVALAPLLRNLLAELLSKLAEGAADRLRRTHRHVGGEAAVRGIFRPLELDRGTDRLAHTRRQALDRTRQLCVHPAAPGSNIPSSFLISAGDPR